MYFSEKFSKIFLKIPIHKFFDTFSVTKLCGKCGYPLAGVQEVSVCEINEKKALKKVINMWQQTVRR